MACEDFPNINIEVVKCLTMTEGLNGLFKDINDLKLEPLISDRSDDSLTV